MRIGLINKQNFKGYAAAPIKNIYFQNNTQESQKNIFNELKEVGKKENFRVQLEQAGKLYEDIESAESSKRYMWAQDNKMIVNKNDKNHVLVSGVKPNFESELGKALEVPTIEANSVFEGGNVFLGKKPDGEKYLIIGEDAVLDMASAKFHRENIGPVKNIAHIETYRMLFAREGEYDTTTSDGRNISFEVKPFDEYEAQAKEQLSKDFDVKPENICILPQLEFHLDMFLRPLDYPYVLVNDKTMSDAVSREFGLTEEKKENGFDVFGMMFSLDKEDKHTKVISTSPAPALPSSGKPEARPFCRVLRRIAKLARTVRKKISGSSICQGRSFRTRRVMTAEVTLGWGIKQWAGTSNKSSGSA